MNEQELNQEVEVSELDALKEQANRLGIKYSNNIGLETLKEKVAKALNADTVETDEEIAIKPKTENQLRNDAKKYVEKLVRVRITCLNPLKKEWLGEFISAGNDLVGNYTKYIPFNSDNAYHIPQIIFNYMQEKQCQIFINRKLENGEVTRVGKLIKEFGFEVLPPLTEEELQELARDQTARGAIEG